MRRPVRRIVLVSAAVVTVVAVIALIMMRQPGTSGRLEVARDLRTETPAERRDEDSSWALPRPGSWRQVPAAPLAARGGHAMVWSGDEVLVWGGFDWYGRPLTDGAAFDPEAGVWSMLPENTAHNAAVAAVWTGRHMVTVSPTETYRFEPSDRVWRRAPALPVPDGHRLTDVMGAGSSVVAVTEPRVRDGSAAVFVLEDAADRWRRLPDPPLPVSSGHVVLADDEKVHILGRPVEDAQTASATLRISQDNPRWKPTGAPPGLEDRLLRKLVGAAHDGIVLWGASGDGGDNYAAVRDDDGWRRLDPGPLPTTWAADSIWMGDRLLVWDRLANRGMTLDPTSNRWTPLSRPPVAAQLPRPAVWTGSSLFVWGAFGAGGAMYTPP